MKGNHTREMGLYKAFTKRWALFCAGKEFTDKDLVYRSRLLPEADFRKIKTDRASIRFCSVFRSNLSGLWIEKGGDFTGNGWDGCSFFQASCTGIAFTMEIYHGCTFGSAFFYQCRMTACHAEDCNYTGALFQEGEISHSTFEQCIFRGAALARITLKDSVFSGCVFEDLKTEEILCSGVVFENCTFYGDKIQKWEGCTFQNCILNC
ncbi:MAG TPA: hypothetical protein DD414_02305 [Lachnospiraceae bacterium]|nr:hypothetical protein [Lachnospiraceae bacterium]